MLRTIEMGTSILVQGIYVKTLPDGRMTVRVDGHSTQVRLYRKRPDPHQTMKRKKGTVRTVPFFYSCAQVT